MTEKQISLKFIQIGIVFTLLASVIYPIYYYIDLPKKLELLFVLIFACSIALSSTGIYHFIALNKKLPALQAGLIFSLLAALVFAIAGAVRIALQWPLENILVQGDQSFIYALSSRVFLGIEFLWKILFGLGIIFLALPSFNHPKIGKILPLIGIIFGILIIVINWFSFPEMPENENLTGMGPAASLWHLLVVIIIMLSQGWIREKSKE